MTTEIKSGNKIFALLVDVADIDHGVFPITNPAWSLQALMMKHKRGHIVTKHTHKKIHKITKQPQEAIVVIRGALHVTIFDRKGKVIAKHNVTPGQCLFTVDGGHEIEATKNALVYEFKNGPYIEDKIPF